MASEAVAQEYALEPGARGGRTRRELRTYKSYENAEEIKRSVALATVTLSLTGMMPALRSQQMSAERLLQLLGEMTESVSKEV